MLSTNNLTENCVIRRVVVETADHTLTRLYVIFRGAISIKALMGLLHKNGNFT